MIGFFQFGWGDGRPRDRRLEMIRETEVFLNWALAKDRNLPRIPTARLDRSGDAGFGPLLSRPGVRQVVGRWWERALDAAWPDRW